MTLYPLSVSALVNAGAHAEPSGSLGHSAPTTLLVGSVSHMPVNTLMMSGRSQKKWNVHSYGAPASHGPIGARLEMHGVLVASHTAPTGLVCEEIGRAHV